MSLSSTALTPRPTPMPMPGSATPDSSSTEGMDPRLLEALRAAQKPKSPDWTAEGPEAIHPGITEFPEALRADLMKLSRFPRTKDIIEDIYSEGSFRIVFDDSVKSASWTTHERCIRINPNQSKGKILQSLLFEMANALQDQGFIHLGNLARSNSISKENYVRAVERYEFDSGRLEAILVEEMQKYGAFSDYTLSCRNSFTADFPTYYFAQQLWDHSQDYIAQYERFNPAGSRQAYRGTLPKRLSRRSHRRMTDLMNQLWYYRHGDASQHEGARRVLRGALRGLPRKVGSNAVGSYSFCASSLRPLLSREELKDLNATGPQVGKILRHIGRRLS